MAIVPHEGQGTQDRGAAIESRHDRIRKAIEDGNAVHYILHVTIVSAKNLRKVAGRKMKPYVKCQLRGKPHTQINSPEAEGRNPDWGFQGMVDGCVLGDALEFFVHSDCAGECVGRGVLPFAQFQESGFSGSVDLQDRMGAKSSLEVKVDVNPVPVTLEQVEDESERCRCFITFVSASGLRPAGTTGKSNPFVVCAVPGREQTAVHSGYITNNLQPEWNELHELEDYAEGDQLLFTVYHWDANNRKRVELGEALITTGDFHELGFEGDLQLTGENAAGVLKVCIDVNGVSEAPNRTIDIYAQVGSRSINFDPESPEMFIQGDETEMHDADHDLPSWMDAKQAAEAMKANMAFSWKKKQAEQVQQGRVEKKHPSELIGPEDRQPVPFQLRSLDTGKVQRLAAYTTVGRSRSQLDERFDLILDAPGICDVSRAHAVIKVWLERDMLTWGGAVYEYKKGRGCYYDEEGERKRVGGGTTVDGFPVDFDEGMSIQPGSVLRFGVNEVWVMESAKLHPRSRAAEAASRNLRVQSNDDPNLIRDLVVPSFTCDSALHRCQDWISIVLVVLEARNEPDEAPCADIIEVKDESGRSASKHEAYTLEQQEAYDVKKILRDVRLGTTLSLRLSNDPLLLAPVLRKVEQAAAKQAEVYESRSQILY